MEYKFHEDRYFFFIFCLLLHLQHLELCLPCERKPVIVLERMIVLSTNRVTIGKWQKFSLGMYVDRLHPKTSSYKNTETCYLL